MTETLHPNVRSSTPVSAHRSVIEDHWKSIAVVTNDTDTVFYIFQQFLRSTVVADICFPVDSKQPTVLSVLVIDEVFHMSPKDADRFSLLDFLEFRRRFLGSVFFWQRGALLTSSDSTYASMQCNDTGARNGSKLSCLPVLQFRFALQSVCPNQDSPRIFEGNI